MADSLIFDYLKNIVGQLNVYYLRDFGSYEDALSKILVDGANVLVLNVLQETALNILHQVWYWFITYKATFF